MLKLKRVVLKAEQGPEAMLQKKTDSSTTMIRN